ncbi:DUF3016 domain-containing protein [Aliiglaciecola sp. M165]|nr:DUF3016 domain-containing protein [Aliiglaciecola sp. M165]
MISGASAAKGNIEVTWENPEDYRDVQPTNQSRKRYREQTFKQLDKYFEELSESLAEGQTLSITVTDLDLAGRVWPSSFVGLGHSGNDVRLIKRGEIPRMTFSYTLTDAQGNVVQESAEVKLKDMGFQDRHNPFFKSENLRYEKNMIRHWFHGEFPEMIAKN